LSLSHHFLNGHREFGNDVFSAKKQPHIRQRFSRKKVEKALHTRQIAIRFSLLAILLFSMATTSENSGSLCH